jgi:hypothetical protein
MFSDSSQKTLEYSGSPVVGIGTEKHNPPAVSINTSMYYNFPPVKSYENTYLMWEYG